MPASERARVRPATLSVNLRSLAKPFDSNDYRGPDSEPGILRHRFSRRGRWIETNDPDCAVFPFPLMPSAGCACAPERQSLSDVDPLGHHEEKKPVRLAIA